MAITIKGEWFQAQVINTNQFDRIQTANETAKVRRETIGDIVTTGLEYGQESFKVEADIIGLSATINAGMCFCYGYPAYDNSSNILTFTPNVNPTLNRIDVVVIRSNWNSIVRANSIIIIEGTVGLGVPNIIQDSQAGIWDVKVAEITIRPLSSNIDDDDVKDTRPLVKDTELIIFENKSYENGTIITELVDNGNLINLYAKGYRFCEGKLNETTSNSNNGAFVRGFLTSNGAMAGDYTSSSVNVDRFSTTLRIGATGINESSYLQINNNGSVQAPDGRWLTNLKVYK